MIAAFRLFGKKEMAQLSVTDLVFVLLISNAVQNAMVGADTTLLGGFISAATMFGLNYLLKWATYRFPKISGVVQGKSVMLIYKGRIIQENMQKTRINMTELQEALREHGVQNEKEVNLAVLEMDGNISVLSNDFQTQSTYVSRHGRREVKHEENRAK